jgi:hypothetical protein
MNFLAFPKTLLTGLLLGAVLLTGTVLGSAPALARVTLHSGTLVCEGVVSHSPYANPGYYEIGGKDEPCNFDVHTAEGRKILKVCHEGDSCKLKGYGTWAAVDFYVKRVISVQKTNGKPEAGEHK